MKVLEKVRTRLRKDKGDKKGDAVSVYVARWRRRSTGKQAPCMQGIS
ncbi:MAG: hypothetical protein HZA14_08685, partial [Nitrospirae bacterium]|nr:hypothetical protein [Nitrospirota bacterium]